MKLRITFAAFVLVAGSVCAAHDQVFIDGFESAGVCGWNQADPVASCYDETTILLPGFVSLPMVEIPAGTFIMGAAEQGSDVDEDEHSVTLTRNYLITKFEITQAQWSAMGFTNPAYYLACGPTCPIENVNYYEAAAFANAVSFSEGLTECYVLTGCTGNPGQDMECAYIGQLLVCDGYRLPNEAQWERAARGLTQTRFSHGDVLQCPDDCSSCPEHDLYMLFCGNDANTTEPVGSRLANGFGLHDMHGLVWEWVEDWYQPNLGTDPVVDPTGPTTGLDRVQKSGSFGYGPEACRSANRVPVAMGHTGAGNGFRLARTLEP